MTNEHAWRYCRKLLDDIGAQPPASEPSPGVADGTRWRESGLAALVGTPGASLPSPPLPLASHADGALAAFRHLAGTPLPFDGQGAELLTLRARMMSLGARGAISPNGSCRLLACADGVIALNLSRDSDWELLEAWLRAPVARTWPAVARGVRDRHCGDLVDQGRLLGLAVANAVTPVATNVPWFTISHEAPPRAGRHDGGTPAPAARVVDLSSLWAGPLCSRLLAWAGCEVTKVESLQRPDGARQGSPAFFAFLHNGKREVTLDFSTREGIDRLRHLLCAADIVIEGSRPRALRQLGIEAQQLLDANPGMTWVSITGYGREEPRANWIAYGDDAAVAAGLSAAVHAACGDWFICGDAVADPFTGLHAAVAALGSFQSGGGRLLSLSLVNTVRHSLEFTPDAAR